jgi:DNA invertase Pin-like site-specific DNA recombinase
MTAFIAYLRVSTQKQGTSGLGIEAQEAAIKLHVKAATVVASYTEVESGKNCKRPVFAAALAHAKAAKATLIVAKLDRLGRDVQFIVTLMNAGVDFVACDNPTANRLTLHILAAVAENEALLISQRTKAALEAARVRGVKLGGFRGYDMAAGVRDQGNAASAKARNEAASARASSLKPVIEALKQAGKASFGQLAKGLNEQGIPAPRGGLWSPASIRIECLRMVG